MFGKKSEPLPLPPPLPTSAEVAWEWTTVEATAQPYGFDVRAKAEGSWQLFCRLEGRDIYASGEVAWNQKYRGNHLEWAKAQALAAAEMLNAKGATPR